MQDRFNLFVKETLDNEVGSTKDGGYVSGERAKKIGDAGGATKYGISLRFLKGCGIKVGDINKDGIIDEQDIVVLTREQAISLYKTYFWNPLYNFIPDTSLAFRLFDFGVNAGVGTAVKILQKLLGVTVDGKFGRQTLEAIKMGKVTTEDYKKAIESYYRSLNKPSLIRGWLNRLFRTTVFLLLIAGFSACCTPKEIIKVEHKVAIDTAFVVPDYFGEGNLYSEYGGYSGYDIQGNDTVTVLKIDTVYKKWYVSVKGDTVRLTDTLYINVPVPKPVDVEVEVIPLWVWIVLGICSLIIVGRLIK